jgi:hypothetical protein
MDLGAALLARLNAATAVTDIVGTRIYWIQRPQGTERPAVVLRQTGGLDVETLDGSSEMIEANITVDCFGQSNLETKALARAVKAALKPPGLQGDFSFDASDVNGPIDLGEPGVEAWEHRATLDCVIRHGAET